MLVLSRRPDQEIVFPHLGVTLKVLRVNGQVVKLGIDAPSHIEVVRKEKLADPLTADTFAPATDTHWLRNRLNTIVLRIHLFHQQTTSGLTEQAEQSFARLVADLRALDRELAAQKKTPAASQPQRVPAPSGNVSLRAARRPYCTLVVEDNDNERELLAGLLRLVGCRCDVAADGEEAIHYLRTHDAPDVVLLDMRMPRCDGWDLLAHLRSDPRLREIPVFAVSAEPPEERFVSPDEAGIDEWFAKPLNPQALVDRLEQMSVPAGGSRS
jgi:carbon storage regulator CsrA